MEKVKLNSLDPELTPEEAEELEAAERMQPVFDEDSPSLSREQLMQFKRIN